MQQLLKDMTLRFEIFPSDLDAIVNFYVGVLHFTVVKDQRHERYPYVSFKRGAVQFGAARSQATDAHAARLPPIGVEIVLEVDDVVRERNQVVAAGWALEEDLIDRPWGLKDFRIVDPAGHYLRITNRNT
jgi:lactoylglutathione lyase